MYTAWMACLTPDKALYNFGRQNEHRHNLYFGNKICRTGVRHALLITGWRLRPWRHSLRDMTFVALTAAVLLAGCIDPGSPAPISVAMAEPSSVSAEVAQAPIPKQKPKPVLERNPRPLFLQARPRRRRAKHRRAITGREAGRRQDRS
jgi:hypothetical protein